MGLHCSARYAVLYKALSFMSFLKTLKKERLGLTPEVLCEIIYGHGEKYDDGTAAIGFTWLFKVNILEQGISLSCHRIHLAIQGKYSVARYYSQLP